jgi:hypothetical protein
MSKHHFSQATMDAAWREVAPLRLKEKELDQRRRQFLRDKREAKRKKRASVFSPEEFSDIVEKFGQRFDAEWKKSLQGIIGAGRVLKQARLELGYGQYGSFLRRIELNDDVARMLMRIADNPVIAKPENFRVLPPSYTTLHRLCLLEPDRL